MEEGQKNSWPEYEGKDVDEVVKELKELHPNLNVIAVKNNSPVTRDFRFDRVRVFYDQNTKLVIGIPRIA